MNFSPELLKQLVSTFQAELEEGAMQLTNGLVELEKINVDNEKRSELIETIFRTAHNLKGASRGLGINHVGDITHHIESIFSTFKTDDTVIPKRTIDVCLEAVDKMQIALQAFISGSEINFDIQDLLSRMESSVTEDSATSPEKSVEESAAHIQNTTKSNLASSSASLPASDSVRIPLAVIDRLSELSEEIQVSKIMIDDHAHHARVVTQLISEFSSVWHDINNMLSGMVMRSDKSPLQKAVNRANDEITQVTSAVNKLCNDMKSHANDYSRLSKAVHDDVALLRLVPANNYLGLLPRYVRELSGSLGKEIDLSVTGGDVYIDKYVLDGLKDPINHIIRNAIDHGIESAEGRKQSGKSPVGNITISVRDAGSKVFFEIRDDGAGLDYKRIREKVLKHHPDAANELQGLSEEDMQQFIFQPGFSTKSEVTTVSGRGVGMDVVKKNIQMLKGSVEIKSVSGEGTAFIISVPLSLSSERGLIVRCDEQVFVLPTSAIERVNAVNHHDIVSIEGCKAILNKGRPVLLKPLSVVLGVGGASDTKEIFSAVLLNISGNEVALAVDEIIGEREIVIKPIQEPLTDLPCVSGATLLDRNKIAIVLNPSDLIEYSMHTTVHYSSLKNNEPAAKREKEPLRILVVDDSITTRTLEKNILESKNYNVTTAVNGQEAWEILQKQPFSLLITDINMPVMDGFELTARVKQSDKLASLPVIIITSLGSDAEKARGVEVGADAYIVKNDFESGALLQMIERLV